MNAVTLSFKCYVYVCVGCNLMASSERSDVLTCCTRCRVRAHRNGSMKALRELAARPMFRVHPATIQQCAAVQRLRPDLADKLLAGTVELDDIRDEISSAFWSLVWKHVRVSA